MKTTEHRRNFTETGWYYAGVGLVILGGIGGLTTCVMGGWNSTVVTQKQDSIEEVARLEACSDIEDEALKAFCINGDDK